jgi:hypothetical protein
MSPFAAHKLREVDRPPHLGNEVCTQQETDAECRLPGIHRVSRRCVQTPMIATWCQLANVRGTN